MSIKNSTPLSERLLCLLKSETSVHDCLVLKCRDTKERRAHRTVLIASSSYFSELLQGDPALETVDVPYTSDVVDIVIEYMYSSDTINFKKKQAIQLFSAANHFALEHLSQQIETFFRFSMDEAMQDEEFLVDDIAEDVQQMKDVFGAIRCDKLLLVSRILAWEKSKRSSPDFVIELLDSVVSSISDGGAQAGRPVQAETVPHAAQSSAATPTFVFATPTTAKAAPESGDRKGYTFSFGTPVAKFGCTPQEVSPFGSSLPEKSPFAPNPSRS